MKPEQRLTLLQIEDHLPKLAHAIKDAIRFESHEMLRDKMIKELKEELETIDLYIKHYLEYPE